MRLIVIPCKHWSSTAHPYGGTCAAGKFSGRPAASDCAFRCDSYDGCPNARQRARAIVAQEQKKTAESIASVKAGGPSVPQGTPGRSCGTKIVKWCGVRWYGVPAPVRWWRAWYHFDPTRHKGCGCILRLKNATIAASKVRQTLSWWVKS